MISRMFLLFISWRILLFFSAIIAPFIIKDFGNKFAYVEELIATGLPIWVRSFGNFDGAHYLKIAKVGYEQYNHVFFPLYPFIMSGFTFLNDNLSIFVMGFLVSNIAFLASLLVFIKLIKLDYSERIANLMALSLVLFPFSFYFGSLYTESLFLLLTIGAFYFARIQKWWLASILGGLASATRLTGILLIPALLIEWKTQRNSKLTSLALLGIIPLGLLFYLFYLYQITGSPLVFYTDQYIFGEQRQSHFIFLPQVFYRYLKMLLTVDVSQMIYLTIVTEFIVSLATVVLLFWGYLKKVRLSYIIYGAMTFIIPTLTGSLSSMPRYVLPIFPVFITIGLLLSTRSKLTVATTLFISTLLLIFEVVLYVRGYWVA